MIYDTENVTAQFIEVHTTIKIKKRFFSSHLTA